MLIEGAQLKPALQGDANVATVLVLSLMPLVQLGGTKTDIAMTAVLSIALVGEPRCAPVLRAEYDPRGADQLCGFRFESTSAHWPTAVAFPGREGPAEGGAGGVRWALASKGDLRGKYGVVAGYT